MNRRQYQKRKNKYEVANKKLYRSCQSKFSKMTNEAKKYWIDKARQMSEYCSKYPKDINHFSGKYKPWIVLAEESKWIFNANWMYIPSYHQYKKRYTFNRERLVKIFKQTIEKSKRCK